MLLHPQKIGEEVFPYVFKIAFPVSLFNNLTDIEKKNKTIMRMKQTSKRTDEGHNDVLDVEGVVRLDPEDDLQQPKNNMRW